MRLLLLLMVLLTFSILGRADEVPPDSLPQSVLETVNQEKGNGVVASAKSYEWGNTTFYNVIIDLDGVPDLELQIVETGKLIRIDHLQEKSDEDPDSGDL